MAVLVTGAAGFIGHATALRLLERGEEVVGLDNFNDYYDPALKEARASSLAGRSSMRLIRADIADADAMKSLMIDNGVTRVIHLAAQAGVRYSIDNPFAYERSNLAGHLSILEACRNTVGLKHLVYASSSSVYGDKPIGKVGFHEDEPAAKPVSLYAATKRANELMSAAYSHLYGFPQTGLRFFTVYGPWGRPDMAIFLFTKKILEGQPIEVFGNGEMARDFTYIDDIVDGILGALDHPPPKEESRVLNIGNSNAVKLMDMITTLENAIGRIAIKTMKPMQLGDVTSTFANISKINVLTGYKPKVMIDEGVPKFVSWYRDYYKI